MSLRHTFGCVGGDFGPRISSGCRTDSRRGSSVQNKQVTGRASIMNTRRGPFRLKCASKCGCDPTPGFGRSAKTQY